jgi:predicted enzyme related to lactoylglutathione lyase
LTENKNLTKMALLGLRTTIYRVSDIQKAKEWYAQFLGFQPYFDEPFYVGFNVEGFELGLQPEEGAVKTKSEGVNTYWGVEDIEATFAKLISMGATEHEKPTDVGGGIQVAMVKDPWGNLFGVIFNPHFGA